MINNLENRQSLAAEIFDLRSIEDLRQRFIDDCNAAWVYNTDEFIEAAVSIGRVVICEADDCDQEARFNLDYVQYPSVCEKHIEGGE